MRAKTIQPINSQALYFYATYCTFLTSIPFFTGGRLYLCGGYVAGFLFGELHIALYCIGDMPQCLLKNFIRWDESAKPIS